MKRWQIAALVLVLAAAHLVFFSMLSFQEITREPRQIREPNFGAREKVWTNPETGETLRIEEFDVSTKLAEPTPAP